MAKLLSLDDDKLRRFSMAADKEPVERREYLDFSLCKTALKKKSRVLNSYSWQKYLYL